MLTEILGLVTVVMAAAILVLAVVAKKMWEARDHLRIERREFARLVNEIADRGRAAIKEGRGMEKVEMDLWFCERAMELWKQAGVEAAKYTGKPFER